MVINSFSVFIGIDVIMQLPEGFTVLSVRNFNGQFVAIVSYDETKTNLVSATFTTLKDGESLNGYTYITTEFLGTSGMHLVYK